LVSTVGQAQNALLTATASISLASSQQTTPLYSLANSGSHTFPGLPVDDAISYSTTLSPGVTYTLNVSISSETRCVTAGYSTSASFSFSALVPEPAIGPVLLLLPAGAPLGRRRRCFMRQAVYNPPSNADRHHYEP
jgi:hypothetical protein